MEYRKSQLKQKDKDNDTEEYPYNCDTDRLGVQRTDAENRAVCAWNSLVAEESARQLADLSLGSPDME